MSRYVLKADPDQDLYGIWSTVVDNVALAGTRAHLAATGVDAERIDRADAHGTSARERTDDGELLRPGGWDAAGLLVREQPYAPCDGYGEGWLPRERLAAFLQAFRRCDDRAAGALLDPLPDDDSEAETTLEMPNA